MARFRKTFIHANGSEIACHCLKLIASSYSNLLDISIARYTYMLGMNEGKLSSEAFVFGNDETLTETRPRSGPGRRKKKKKQKNDCLKLRKGQDERNRRRNRPRPRSAPPVQRNLCSTSWSSERERDPNNWREMLSRNDLFASKDAAAKSRKHLRKSKMKKLRNEKGILEDVELEKLRYERACVERMHEASKWASALGLEKKYNPLFAQTGLVFEKEDFDDKLLKSQFKRHADGDELRCEVVARKDSHSRIISCELFEKDYDRLKKKFEAALRERDFICRESPTEPMAEEVSREARSMLPPVVENNVLVEYKPEKRKETQKPRRKELSLKEIDDAEIGMELNATISTVKDLTRTLEGQAKIIEESGWNMKHQEKISSPFC